MTIRDAREGDLPAIIEIYNAAIVALFAQAGFERWGRLPRIARFENAERDLAIVGR